MLGANVPKGRERCIDVQHKFRIKMNDISAKDQLELQQYGTSYKEACSVSKMGHPSSLSQARVPKQMPNIEEADAVPKMKTHKGNISSNSQALSCPDKECDGGVLFGRKGGKVVHTEACKYKTYLLNHSEVRAVRCHGKVVRSKRVSKAPLQRLSNENEARWFLRYYLASLSE